MKNPQLMDYNIGTGGILKTKRESKRKLLFKLEKKQSIKLFSNLVKYCSKILPKMN